MCLRTCSGLESKELLLIRWHFIETGGKEEVTWERGGQEAMYHLWFFLTHGSPALPSEMYLGRESAELDPQGLTLYSFSLDSSSSYSLHLLPLFLWQPADFCILSTALEFRIQVPTLPGTLCRTLSCFFCPLSHPLCL